jgi:hypothetical protein
MNLQFSDLSIIYIEIVWLNIEIFNLKNYNNLEYED